jgi:peptide/histidine transporter 3/4
MSILIPIYQFIVVPSAQKITGHTSGITQLQHVGIGLILSFISMAIASRKRRNQANKNPMQPLSLFWLSFQYGNFGIADMFTVVGLLELPYREAPTGIRSLSISFTYLSLSFGYFLSSILVDLINSITKRITPSKQGWLNGDNLNDNNLNHFYWFLAILGSLNSANYLYWASWFKYKKDNSESGIKSRTQNGSFYNIEETTQMLK